MIAPDASPSHAHHRPPATTPAFVVDEHGRAGLHQAEHALQAYWEGIIALGDGRATLLIDDRGRVARATPTASALMSVSDGIRLSQGVLTADLPIDDARLRSVLASATCRTAPSAGAIRLRRVSGRPDLLVIARPVANGRRAAVSALVTIIDPLRTSVTNAALWQTLFELTTRETEFAALLMLGHSVESAAVTLQIAVPTARSHLRSIFQKTGTDRQSDLALLLNRIR